MGSAIGGAQDRRISMRSLGRTGGLKRPEGLVVSSIVILRSVALQVNWKVEVPLAQAGLYEDVIYTLKVTL